MRVVRNRFVPVRGFKAVNLFGVLFVRGDAKVDERTMNHERIHTAQMREMGYVPFYVWYVVEWLIRLAWRWDCKVAYRGIGFEREAYGNEHDTGYLVKRRRWAWTGRIRG